MKITVFSAITALILLVSGSVYADTKSKCEKSDAGPIALNWYQRLFSDTKLKMSDIDFESTVAIKDSQLGSGYAYTYSYKGKTEVVKCYPTQVEGKTDCGCADD